MCKEITNKSETKKWRDEWLDGEGKFHRKIVIETITSPINTRQAIDPHFQEFRHSPVFPGLWGSMQIPDVKQFFGQGEFQGKPLIDLKAFVEQGKKLLEKMGIDFKDVEKSAEELVKEIKQGDENQPKKEQEKVKPLKIVYNKETKPLEQKKEVEKCQKKKPMRNQMSKKIPILKKVKK